MKINHLKREQATLFVILGIVLLFTFVFVIFVKNTLENGKTSSSTDQIYQQETENVNGEKTSYIAPSQEVIVNNKQPSENTEQVVNSSNDMQQTASSSEETFNRISEDVIVDNMHESINSTNNTRKTITPHDDDCNQNTACGETIVENGVTKWCRDMNGEGYKWVVKQYCNTGCNDVSCQNNPVGVFAQVGITSKATQGCSITTIPTNLVCTNSGWQSVTCGDHLCTPEAGENEANCMKDCKGVSNKVIDTTGYWPLKQGNYWLFEGRITGDVSVWSNASVGDTFSTMLYIEPQENVCGKNYYPVVFSKNKDYGYWGPGYPQNLRWFLSDYSQDNEKYYDDFGSNQEYISAPISKFYNRNSEDPFDNSNFAAIAYFASEKPQNYPPYVILPRKVALNKTILNYQNTKFILHEFSNCEWLSDSSQYSHQVFYTWMLQYSMEHISTPAYTGDALRVRFDERKLNGSVVGREDWYFAKNVGVVRIHWYSDWSDPEGSTKLDLVLKEYGHSAIMPRFD